MKKMLALSLIFLFLIPFVYADDALPVDEDVKAGTVSEKDVSVAEEEKDVTEEAEELDTKEANEKEAAPTMPEESEKSVYFGDVRVIVQYTSLAMDDFNRAAGAVAKHIKNGLDLGLALGIKINSYLSPFFRFDFITSLTEPGSYDFVMYTNALPLDIGLEYSLYIPDSPFRLAASACAGVTLAYGKYDSIDHEKIPYEEIRTFGSGFNAIADISLQYQITAAISAGISAGYRYMPVSKMTIIDGNNEEWTKTGQSLKYEGKDIVFDYSGLTAGLSIGMNY